MPLTDPTTSFTTRVHTVFWATILYNKYHGLTESGSDIQRKNRSDPEEKKTGQADIPGSKSESEALIRVNTRVVYTIYTKMFTYVHT